jgi:hypothetical protein
MNSQVNFKKHARIKKMFLLKILFKIQEENKVKIDDPPRQGCSCRIPGKIGLTYFINYFSRHAGKQSI